MANRHPPAAVAPGAWLHAETGLGLGVKAAGRGIACIIDGVGHRLAQRQRLLRAGGAPLPGKGGGRDPGRFPEPAVEIAWRKRSEEHTSELQSLMRISYAVFCLKKKNNN